MPELKPIDRLEIHILVDNATDSLCENAEACASFPLATASRGRE